MKRLISPISIILFLAIVASEVKATGISGDTNSPHIIHANTHPSYGTRGLTNHHFEVHVEGKPLTRLLIELPEQLNIHRGVKVADSMGNSIQANITINKQIAALEFAQPVPIGTIVSIDILGVETSIFGLSDRMWQYKIFGNLVGLDRNIILGTTTVKIDDD
ncbi:hypothetical protein [Okeania sp. SIO1I7]|uniref:hypothetical protein n=1 Tax=Okeania sp. SIO1I7 TaxID=2607772 RepID=UPI0013FAF0CE|nr:hypothetical protein [Okeania sp. SIO1I7]NET30131.1 hypothetical protein [Okeania sp. SIO1I7]